MNYVYNYWIRNPSEKQITNKLEFAIIQNKMLLYVISEIRNPF